MSLSIEFSLLLYILSGFHRHVRPSQNKTFIFNKINLFYFLIFCLRLSISFPIDTCSAIYF